MKVREIGVDGKAGPERVVAPAPAKAADQADPPKQRHVTAMFSVSLAENALIVTMRIAAWVLIGLSVIGTFYGARGLDAPITTPWVIAQHLFAAPLGAMLALLAQGVLSLVQWGCRGLARSDRRWWSGYAVALGLSVWWNWAAYGDPLIALGTPWLVAFGIVLGGDIFPEVTLVSD